MTDKLFDDFFKQKLENHDSGAPMNVWEKVRRELHGDDNDKGIIWWRNPLWLIALFFIVGGITTTGIVGNQKGWFTSDKSLASTNINTQEPSIIKPVDENKSTPVKTTEDIIDNSSPSNDLNSKEPTLILKDKTKPDEANTIASNSKDHFNDKIKNSKWDITNSGKNKIQVHKKLSGTNKQSVLNDDNFSSKNSITTHLDGRKVVDQLTDYQLNPALTEASSKRSFNSLLSAQKVKALSSVNFQLFTGCPTIGPPRRNDLYIEFYGSGDNVNRSLTGTSFTPDNYIDKRKEAEKKKVGFSAGVRIAKNLGERTILKTGINYSQINETLKYINEKDTRTITVITTRTVTSGGQTITISDTTTVTQVGTTYTTFHNRYRTIDIPLIFSYELGNSRNYTLGINAGAIVNLQSIYKGHILDTTLNPISINTDNTLGVNAWRKNIGIGLYASISLYKRLTDNMQLFFEPYTRINLKPVNVSETVIKQKYTTTGLQVGLRFNLFHKRQRYIE